MAEAWNVPAGNLIRFFDGTHDLDGDTLRMALFVDAYDPSTQAYGTLNEASGDGYTAGGQALAGVTLDEAAGVVTFDANDVVWDADGGELSARYAVIYNETDAGDHILFVSDLTNGAGGDITATNDTFTVQINADGIATFTQT